MLPPTEPYQPYAAAHLNTKGPGDARPTAFQVLEDCKAIDTLRGKVAVITGCSTGLGVETVRVLYEAGLTLFLTSRDMKRQEGVIHDIVANSPIFKDAADKPPRPTGVEIHLDSLDSVRKGAEAILGQTNAIHLLINNAGVMAIPYEKTADGFEIHLETNHMAHFLLFQLLEPALLRSAASKATGRVITLSSAGHRFSGFRFDDMNWAADPSKYNRWEGYGQSKTANVYMAASITRHYASKGLIGLSVHPGGIITELGKHMVEEDLQVSKLGQWDHLMKNVEQGAATSVFAALSPHFDDTGNGGRYLADVGEDDPVGSNSYPAGPGYAAHVYDEEKEEQVWRISCEAVGVSVDE